MVTACSSHGSVATCEATEEGAGDLMKYIFLKMVEGNLKKWQKTIENKYCIRKRINKNQQ